MKQRKFGIVLYLLQIVLTTTLLYFGLTYNEGYVGEKQGTIKFADYIDQGTRDEERGTRGEEKGTRNGNGSIYTSTLDSSTGITSPDSILDPNTGTTSVDKHVLASRRVDEAMNEVYTPIHSAGVTDEDLAGYDRKFQDICFANLALCMKVRFASELNYKDKYMYLASIVTVVSFMDKILHTNVSVQETLDEIQVTQGAGSRRGHSTRDTVVLNIGNIQTYAEFLEVFTHEIGHIMDLGVIQGNNGSKDTLFTEFNRAVFAKDDPSILYYQTSWSSEKIRKSSAKKEDFCSGYGMYDPFEDIAECFNLYMNHNAMFKEIAKNNNALKQKYNFIASYFDNQYLFSADGNLSYIQSDITRRPYDTTKIQ